MRILILVLVILTQGCVSLPKCENNTAFDDSSSAKIVVYREKKLLGFGEFQYVGVNQCNLGILKNGTYLEYMIPPGDHTVSIYNDVGVKRFAMGISLNTEETIYLKYRYDVTDTLVTTGTILVAGKEKLEIVEAEKATIEISDLEGI